MNSYIQKINLPNVDRSWILPMLICCGFVVLYLLIIHFEYHNHLDDTWSVTQAYYYINFGTEFDYLNGRSALNLAHFAKTYSFVYGAWAEIFGWGRIAHQVLSVILAWIGVYLWARVFMKAGASRAMAISFTIVLLLSVAFAAHTTRTRGDSLVFLLGAIVLWAAVNKQWFWATLVALIMIESHPTGAIYCVYVAGIWLINSDLTKMDSYKNTALQVIPAALLGIGYYLLLHYEHLDSLIESASAGSSGDPWAGSILKSYFWVHGSHKRHMLDFFLFILSYIIVLYFYKDRESRLWKFMIFLPLLAVLADMLITRGSKNYVIHLYPSLAMLAVYAWHKVKLPVYLFPLLVAIYMLPQYAYWVYKNHNFYFPSYIAKVHKHVAMHTEIATADVVIGNYAQWFAFNDKNESMKFAAETNVNIIDKVEDKYIVWANDYNRNKFIDGQEDLSGLKQVLSVCPMEVLSSFDYGGHHVKFEAYDCRDKKLLNSSQNKTY